MNDPHLNQSALEECLQTLNHLFIDIAKLTYEQGYEEIVGGYCELKVATLDSGIAAARLVAAKKLRLGVRATEPKRLAFRLARELKVWAGLRHPHVLPLLGFYLDDNYKTAVLISEYMNNGDLKDYISRVKPSFNERLRLVRDLTDGLTYLHNQHAPIRHGDLKPGNVLVNSDRRALLADFGLSRALDTSPTGFTTGNDARGTVRYSSPEVLLHGTAATSLPNDMWSWGCLVFEALTDKIPFADIQPEPQLIIALVQGKSPNDTKQLSIYPPQLGNLLAECWSPEPDQRPTAADCLRVVESTLPRLETGGSSGTTDRARLPSPGPLPPLISLAPPRTVADHGPSIPNKFTPHSTQSHSLKNLQQEPHTFPAENSQRNNTLSDQRAENEARRTQQISQNSQGPQLRREGNRPLTTLITDARARPKPIVPNSTLVNGFSPDLSPEERSILARQESMQRLAELKLAREARNAATGVKIDSGTDLPPSRVFASGQVIAARTEEATAVPAVPTTSTSVTVSVRVAPQPAVEWTYPTGQGAAVREVSSEAGPSNLVLAPSAGPSLAINSMDDSELLEFSGGSRLRIRKGAFTPAWAIPPRVLLVDDDQVSRKIFSKFLQVSGCTLDVATDGIGAVNKMNLEKYDLVLMDIVMPRLDGVSATSLIRQFDHMTPIIAMTSKYKPNDVDTYLSCGMNDILQKPFTRESLFTMLEKHLMHLKAITMARPVAEEPSKVLSEDEYSSMLNLLGIRDGMNPPPSLDPPPVTVMAMTNPARSGKRTLGKVDDDREGKRPRFEVVE